MNFYYADENVVCDQNDRVMCVVSPVLFRKWIAKKMAQMIADAMNEYEYDERDTLRGGGIH